MLASETLKTKSWESFTCCNGFDNKTHSLGKNQTKQKTTTKKKKQKRKPNQTKKKTTKQKKPNPKETLKNTTTRKIRTFLLGPIGGTLLILHFCYDIAGPHIPSGDLVMMQGQERQPHIFILTCHKGKDTLGSCSLFNLQTKAGTKTVQELNARVKAKEKSLMGKVGCNICFFFIPYDY